jgi:hypothetical protein
MHEPLDFVKTQHQRSRTPFQKLADVINYTRFVQGELLRSAECTCGGKQQRPDDTPSVRAQWCSPFGSKSFVDCRSFESNPGCFFVPVYFSAKWLRAVHGR